MRIEVESEYSSRDVRQRFPSRALSVFVVALLATLTIGRFSLEDGPDWLYRPGLTPKLDHLRTSATAYDIVFVGNSRVVHAIDPSVFDHAMAERGCVVSSFNLGAPAMSLLEMREAIEVAAARRGGAPAMIVTVDVPHLTFGAVRGNELRNRLQVRLDELGEAIAYRRNLPNPPFKHNALEVGDLTVGYLAAELPFGAAYRRLFRDREDEQQLTAIDQLWANSVDAGGFVSLDDLPTEEVDELRHERNEFILAGGMAERWSDEPATDEQVDQWLHTIDTQVGLVPDGIEAAHVLLPSVYSAGIASSAAAAWATAHPETPLINLFDLDVLPTGDEPAFWTDADHVSRLGASAVSVALAQQMCPIWSAQPRSAG